MNEKEINLESMLEEFSKVLPKFADRRIDYSKSNKRPVITCFIKFNDKILILKRSNEVSTDKGLWSSVSGYIDEVMSVQEKAHKELMEELNITLDMIKKTKIGEPYEYTDSKTWIIFPVLVELNTEPDIRLDWEHTEYKWIYPFELKQYEIMADLDNTLARVL